MFNEEIITAIVVSTLLVFFLVAVVAITLVISAKRKLIQEMELTQTKLNYEQELRQVQTEISEQMMKHFAQELHDNIGQIHTAMRIHIENQKLDFPSLVTSFNPLEIYLTEVTQQLRLLSRTLNNDYLSHIGLIEAIQLEIQKLNHLKRFAIQMDEVSGESNLSKNQELMVFRIFQEITQNILKHAKAKHVTIWLNNQKNKFELQVLDDGIGFDSEAVLNSPKASGLRNLFKRAEMAQLQLRINSSPGNGCQYELSKTDYKYD